MRRINNNAFAATAICVLSLSLGCQPFRNYDFRFLPAPPIEVPVSNPSHVPEMKPDFLWRMIVDAVDDNFRIELEDPVRRDSELWCEGRLRTYPEVSRTIFEPWRTDTSPGFETLQSTFQTIRRIVEIRVANQPDGYQIEVVVIKEKEDVDQSQFASAGSSAQRHDGSIVRNQNQLRQSGVTLGWYEVGRDRDLERKILAGILGRVTNVEPPVRKFMH